MKDAYINAFHSIVKETQEETGFELPDHIEVYIVMLLAHNMDRPNFLPERSFAEAYLKLRQPAEHTAKELGDACLIVSGAFPTYGKKHGLSRSYYQNIGISSYDMIAKASSLKLFESLSMHFVFLSDFIGFVTNPKSQHTSIFR